MACLAGTDSTIKMRVKSPLSGGNIFMAYLGYNR